MDRSATKVKHADRVKSEGMTRKGDPDSECSATSYLALLDEAFGDLPGHVEHADPTWTLWRPGRVSAGGISWLE